MKRILLLAISALMGMASHAQLLSWTPDFPKEDDPAQNLVITMEASKGNRGLLNYTSDVYVHIGVITNVGTGWQHTPFTWATTAAASKATSLGNNKWQFTINGSLRSFFGITNAAERIQKIGILFRSGDGNTVQRNADGSDMYIPVYTSSLAVRFSAPLMQPTLEPTPEPITKNVGDNITLTATSNKSATLKLFLNGNLVQTTTGTTITVSPALTAPGTQTVLVEANDGTETKTQTFSFFVAGTTNVAPLPAGVKAGINYEAGNTSVTLVLYAPNKNRVSLIGDFPGGSWAEQSQFTMNKTPDGTTWWIRITGLTAGTEYAFQYLVDGTLRIADPYAEKILDPNDQFISATTYPGLKPYPTGTTGIVSVLQTAAPGYTWTVNNFARPDKRSLVIYELLLRDFVAAHDWKTLKDTLGYLKRLGINAIEVLPFNEFEGNDSWGYNSDFYFAPDKYYGTKNSLKEFIDVCHANGIAVIMDMVLNHSYGPSPLARLYWDAANNRPAADNPWYNPVQPHAFGFGDDFNHESAVTKSFFNRVLQHWITEYKIDGYRLDFTKGLTQKPSTNDATFSAYDASRIAILNGYYNAIKSVDPNTYVILEHFADNTEEKELANNGMMLWGNLNYNYTEAAMGYVQNSNFDWGIYTTRNWNTPHLVTYMESHDEERIMYKTLQFGNASGSYNTKNLSIALQRVELDAAFFFTIPGPKMIWQFGELGYDQSINRCTDGTINNNCRLTPKPIRWDYLQDANRKKVYDVFSNLIKLRFHPLYKEAFISGRIDRSLGAAFKWIKVSSGDTSHLVVVGNFDVNAGSGNVTFPSAGTWYDYFTNTTITATGAAQNISLQPGEYHVYVNRNVNNNTTTPVLTIPTNGTTLEAKLYPNPLTQRFVIEMYVPQSGTTTIELFNALGQYAGKLQSSFLQKGKHMVPLNRGPLNLAKGQYYIKISTKNESKVLGAIIQ